MDLRRMAILATVVECGSMRRAARELGLTPSAVSQHLKQLEQEMGVTLLRRSTRQLALTDAGEVFYTGCASMLAEARSAHEQLAALRQGVSGELSISSPVAFATPHLARALAPVLLAHPELSLRLLATDDILDVVRERIDISITIGVAPPSKSLVRRRLAKWDIVLVGAPSYLARRSTPTTVDDLSEHDLLGLPAWHHGGDLLTGPDGRDYRVPVKRRLTSNSQLVIREMTLAGCGLSFHVMPEIADELADGRLVRVLPDFTREPASVDALMPPRSKQPAKVRAALDAIGSYVSRLTSARR